MLSLCASSLQILIHSRVSAYKRMPKLHTKRSSHNSYVPLFFSICFPLFFPFVSWHVFRIVKVESVTIRQSNAELQGRQHELLSFIMQLCSCDGKHNQIKEFCSLCCWYNVNLCNLCLSRNDECFFCSLVMGIKFSVSLSRDSLNLSAV